MKQIALVGNQDLGELCIKENQVACQQEALKQEINNTFEKSNACFFFFLTVHNRSLTEAKKPAALALNVYIFWTFISRCFLFHIDVMKKDKSSGFLFMRHEK